MDDFKAIYRILEALDAGLDCDEPSPEAYSAQNLGINENRRENLIWMMQREGYVDGVTRTAYYDGTVSQDESGMRITIKGLEYLHGNLLMAKAANAIKGIAPLIP